MLGQLEEVTPPTGNSILLLTLAVHAIFYLFSTLIVFQVETICQRWHHLTVLFLSFSRTRAKLQNTLFCSTLSPHHAGNSKGSI
jgi:hypothetical protein